MTYSLNDPKIKEALQESKEVERHISLSYLNSRMYHAGELRDICHDKEAYNKLRTEISGSLKIMTELSLITEEERIIIESEYDECRPVPVDKELFQSTLVKKNKSEIER